MTERLLGLTIEYKGPAWAWQGDKTVELEVDDVYTIEEWTSDNYGQALILVVEHGDLGADEDWIAVDPMRVLDSPVYVKDRILPIMWTVYNDFSDSLLEQQMWLFDLIERHFDD